MKPPETHPGRIVVTGLLAGAAIHLLIRLSLHWHQAFAFSGRRFFLLHCPDAASGLTVQISQNLFECVFPWIGSHVTLSWTPARRAVSEHQKHRMQVDLNPARNHPSQFRPSFNHRPAAVPGREEVPGFLRNKEKVQNLLRAESNFHDAQVPFPVVLLVQQLGIVDRARGGACFLVRPSLPEGCTARVLNPAAQPVGTYKAPPLSHFQLCMFLHYSGDSIGLFVWWRRGSVAVHRSISGFVRHPAANRGGGLLLHFLE
mmetsp:Transcript_25769/g.62078  ORF Transcript_25769/g.62078 Transcript_25769/m.62078 type:complete len:258 (+) Transcript_25769:987-1760(+)